MCDASHPRHGALRAVVIGLSGSGKTTFATRLCEATGARQIELDLLNWRPGWVSRYDTDYDGLRDDLVQEMEAPSWVIAGGYSRLRPLTFERANTVVWLDLPFGTVLRQVFFRSLRRAAFRTEQLNGNKEDFARWFERGHPIRIVLENYYRKKRQFESELTQPINAHLTVHRCTSHGQVQNVLALLSKKHSWPTNRLNSPSHVLNTS